MHHELRRGAPRDSAGIPGQVSCAACGQALAEPFGWCSNCRAAYCLSCGRAHFCAASCPASGCIAGLCVRLVEDGVLSAGWGLPGPCPCRPDRSTGHPEVG